MSHLHETYFQLTFHVLTVALKAILSDIQVKTVYLDMMVEFRLLFI